MSESNGTAQIANVLVAMIADLDSKITAVELRASTEVQDLKREREALEKLAAWKPGDPLPAYRIGAEMLAQGLPAAAPNSHQVSGQALADQDRNALALVKEKHGLEFVRSTALKEEFPHVNFQALFGRKLIRARGQGAGREYAVKA